MILTKPDFAAILNEAHDAARMAVIAKGAEDMNAFDCGMAWVVIDGTSPLARFCRATRRKMANDTYATRAHYGDKHWQKGWQFWKPGDFAGQAIGHHVAGATAFQSVLVRHGINATVGSRYD